MILRHPVQNGRLYCRALEDFTRLKVLREEMPNEPIPVPEPEEIQQLDDPLPQPDLDGPKLLLRGAAELDPAIAERPHSKHETESDR